MTSGLQAWTQDNVWGADFQPFPNLLRGFFVFSRQTQRGKSRTYIALAPGTSEVSPSLCQQSRRLAFQGSFRRLAVAQKAHCARVFFLRYVDFWQGLRVPLNPV